tara:strand:+ start:315 stop:545 length:231 start_codon:yes stop_codon:yes gene_type:complete
MVLCKEAARYGGVRLGDLARRAFGGGGGDGLGGGGGGDGLSGGGGGDGSSGGGVWRGSRLLINRSNDSLLHAVAID